MAELKHPGVKVGKRSARFALHPTFSGIARDVRTRGSHPYPNEPCFKKLTHPGKYVSSGEINLGLCLRSKINRLPRQAYTYFFARFQSKTWVACELSPEGWT
jgi:hypothetical protein